MSDPESKQLKLLLVDDEAGLMEVLAKRIARRDIDVTTAFSAAAALQALRRQDFDVAVLDLEMKDMDAIEVLKVFKKMLPSMPVIILTGPGTMQSAGEGLKEGAFDYLTKPYELEDLIAKIRAAVARGR